MVVTHCGHFNFTSLHFTMNSNNVEADKWLRVREQRDKMSYCTALTKDFK